MVRPNEWIRVDEKDMVDFMKTTEPNLGFIEWVQAHWDRGSEMVTNSGHKHDNGKSRVDLLDSDFLMAMGECLKYGAEKPGYGSHNWRGGLAYSRLIGAILRHILAINRGEDIDPESRFPHTAHLGCEVQFLHWMMRYKPELDDRFKY